MKGNGYSNNTINNIEHHMSLACDVLNPSVEITSRDCDIHQAVFIHHNSDVVVDKLSASVDILYYLSVQHYKKTL
jgi:hypothetical protein